MSGGDRDEGTAPLSWIFPTIGIFLALGLAWGFGFLQARETEHRYHTPRAYQQSAKAAAQRACVGREVGAVFECINEHVEAAQQSANTEQDLSAQQRAASSALFSAIFAFATLLVTAIGVWFVKRTLEATLEAVADTGNATRAMLRQNEISEEAQRPWLQVVSINSKIRAEQAPEGLEVHIGTTVTIRNSGQRPAHSASQRIEIGPRNGDRETRQFTRLPSIPGGVDFTFHTFHTIKGIKVGKYGIFSFSLVIWLNYFDRIIAAGYPTKERAGQTLQPYTICKRSIWGGVSIEPFSVIELLNPPREHSEWPYGIECQVILEAGGLME